MTPVYYSKFINREDLQLNPNCLFVFGDNTERYGLGGQAKSMRGEPNAHGIATLWRPGKYFEDKDYDQIVSILDFDLGKLAGLIQVRKPRSIVFPMCGIGTGLAYMELHAPKAYDYLCSQLELQFGIINCIIDSRRE